MKSLLLACAISLFGLAASAAGFTRATLHDGTEIGIWYPSKTTVPSAPNTKFGQALAINAKPSKRMMPLVVVSHGYGSWLGGHATLALELANAGFVVAAPTHQGSSLYDLSQSPSQWMRARPKTLSRTIDYVLRDWRFGGRVDQARISAFGYSAGGNAVLSAAGARPDIDRLQRICPRLSLHPICREAPKGLRAGGVETWPVDPRLHAIVLAAPAAGRMFSVKSLQGLSMPIQLWAATEDRFVKYDKSILPLLADLPPATEAHTVQQGRHSAFLEPCPPNARAKIPAPIWAIFCTDPEGFDRTGFQKDMSATIIQFLRAAPALRN